MTPPAGHKDDHFRFDSEFVKMISTQAQQGALIDSLKEKLDEVKQFNAVNFDKISNSLENVANSVQSIKSNCIAHKVMEETNKKEALILGVKPELMKALAVLIVLVVGYFLGVPIK